VKLRIEKSVYGGSGLARADGKAIFVPLSLPGEVVEAAITQDKSGFANAELQSILEASPARTAPACAYFGECGGCHYQHAAYAAQVELKLAILRESLDRAHVPDVPSITPVTADPLGYRNRIRLHVGRNPFSLGYKIRNSHRNLPVDSCPIAAPVLQHALRTLSHDCARLDFLRFVTEVELFTDGAESALLLSLWTGQRGLSPATCEEMFATLRQILPELQGLGIFVAEKDRRVSRLLAHAGSDSLLYAAGQHNYRVGLGSFFQVNRFLIDPLVQLVTESETGTRAWDLYAGVGLFSLPLTGSFAEVTAVESSSSATRDLRENLRGTPAHIVASDTAAFLRQAQTRRLPAPDLIVVDPPRAGLGREMTDALATLRARKITYVSCDPATLSRDLAALVQSGYRLVKMHLLDLFPQTFHLETVTHLSLE
jgi:23S rRNA (uracil1939-C5)-methyltransferase